MNKTAKIGLVIGGAMVLAPFLVFARAAVMPTAVREDMQKMKAEMQQKREVFMEDIRTKREAFRDEILKKREVFRAEAQKRRDALKKKLGEERAKRIEQFFGNMVEKFEKAIDRLNSFADRIEERLNKAEKNGKDVAALNVLLTTAREKISGAETALVDAKAKYAEATASNQDFKVAFKKVHEIVKGVVVKVKEAHRALVDVINSTKGLGAEHPATTTPSTR